jgi:hypothetical protein
LSSLFARTAFLVTDAAANIHALARGANFLQFDPGQGVKMILVSLVAASLIVSVAADPGASWPPAGDRPAAVSREMSAHQKRAMIRSLVTSANECIARRVSTDPRFATASAGAVNELIVESVPSCLEAVRALIDAHDRLFGEGAGESYFMGPYLDALPGAIHSLVSAPK